jgi:hypothetical protein
VSSSGVTGKIHDRSSAAWDASEMGERELEERFTSDADIGLLIIPFCTERAPSEAVEGRRLFLSLAR